MIRRRRPAGPSIACQQWVELVTDYLEDALPAELRAEVDRHLDECPHCREYLEQMRRTVAVAAQLGHEELPDDVVDALARAFAEYRGPSR